VTGSAPESPWSAGWQEAMRPTLDAVLAHPFLTGLSDGRLDRGAFLHFVIQDSHYLREYARALLVVGAGAPSAADTALLARHAFGAVEAELTLHAGLLEELGLAADAVERTPAAPTTVAYTSYLLATAHGSDFAGGLAAVLPCYWIYAEVGRVLADRGSPDRLYQRWINSYSDPAFAGVVAEVLGLVDRVGAGLTGPQELAARSHLLVTSRYEWMFWDAAYRREAWPITG